jgi:hypothetical protein
MLEDNGNIYFPAWLSAKNLFENVIFYVNRTTDKEMKLKATIIKKHLS